MDFIFVLWRCSEENKFDVGFSITKSSPFKVHLKSSSMCGVFLDFQKKRWGWKNDVREWKPMNEQPRMLLNIKDKLAGQWENLSE